MSNEKRPSLYDIIHQAQGNNKSTLLRECMANRANAACWPHSAVLELSPVCNLACKMCYIRKTPAEAEELGGVIGVEQWKQIVDRCVEIGVLNFTLSGGECLLYPGFLELYNYIYEKTPFITLMTNLALLSDEHMELFRRKRPDGILITVYGASRETYGRLCGNPDAYDKVMKALETLKANRIPFRIQMTVVRENVDDLAEVMHLADRLGVRFNYMDSLTTFGNTDEVMREAEKADHEKVVRILTELRGSAEKQEESERKEKEMLARRKEQGRPSRPGIQCNAARNTLCISWQGEMKPCTVLDAYKVSVLTNDFRETWLNMVRWADSLCVLPECYTCEYATKCVNCIAQHYNDTKDVTKPSPRLCWKIQHPEGTDDQDVAPQCPDCF